jgi:hypothetical protein
MPKKLKTVNKINLYQLIDIEDAAVKAGFKPQRAWEEIQQGERANGTLYDISWLDDEDNDFYTWLHSVTEEPAYVHIYW